MNDHEHIERLRVFLGNLVRTAESVPKELLLPRTMDRSSSGESETPSQPVPLNPLQEFVCQVVERVGQVYGHITITGEGMMFRPLDGGESYTITDLDFLWDACLETSCPPFEGDSSHLRLAYQKLNAKNSKTV